MKANVNYNKKSYLEVELTNVNEWNVCFRIYTDNPNHQEYIEQLVNDGKADVSFYHKWTFVIVKRENVSDIIYL